MKKRFKNILAFVFLGGIMATSGVVIAIPGITPDGMMNNDMTFTQTGTPADNFADEQRIQFCGQNDTAKSNRYITEYDIPTACTQPLAITSDVSGDIWFMEGNTGQVAHFDVSSENFSEFENPFWPEAGRSMMWGMDYASDHSIWYTDDSFDSIWKFSIDSQQYQRINFPYTDGAVMSSTGQPVALPQKLEIDGSKIIVNDFTGNKITIFDATGNPQEASSVDILSPVRQSVTGAFTQDSDSNIWYTNWIPEKNGVLIKFAQENYTRDTSLLSVEDRQNVNALRYMDNVRLPSAISTINGIVADNNDIIWLADTASSNFYSFNPLNRLFTQYVTSPVPQSAFGNHTGAVTTTPLSRPYWMNLGDAGQIIFNEHAANRIGVFHPTTEKLVEYSVPSKNPTWADCDDATDCGLAQVFDFTVVGDKVWFTEWAANRIGVLDMSIPPTVDVELDSRFVFYNETGTTVNLEVSSLPTLSEFSSLSPSPTAADFTVIGDSTSPNINIELPADLSQSSLGINQTLNIPISIKAIGPIPSGQYKVLVGVQADDVAVSQFFTLLVAR